jgi:hypothetical protein
MNQNLRKIIRSDQIKSRTIRDVFDYWQSKRVGTALPRRADIDPADIAGSLPNLLIADIEHHPFRVKYRLVGTRVVQMTGFEFTGKYLDEIALPDDEGPFLECYQAACDWAAAVTARIKWRLEDGSTGAYDICILPLSGDGKTVNMAMSVECYETIERDFSFVREKNFRRTGKPN